MKREKKSTEDVFKQLKFSRKGDISKNNDKPCVWNIHYFLRNTIEKGVYPIEKQDRGKDESPKINQKE